ncbi:tyrosine-type DNA invertase [Serratia marcescens]|uniref:tyrosine-type DNA invertase n=1 Tax=Serratia marcescens TaxID=615 RepID=UPI0002B8889D|nr:tyrosine-type DNA invertase [Serratia marcescens]EMF07322.1 type 1 fimbriae regulatory protein fimb [Serratia marcescens VGH107]
MSERKYLTQYEVECLLLQAQKGDNAERNYCMIYMSFIHGFRVSEVCHLRLSDLDLEGHCLYIRRMKSGFCTNHPLLEGEFQAIKAWLAIRTRSLGADSEWLFISRQGKALTRQRVYQIISQLGKDAGLPVGSHPHMLRHACGFALADRGIDTRLIQDYLGHKNIRHTVRYTASNAERFADIWASTKIKRKTRRLGPNCQIVY